MTQAGAQSEPEEVGTLAEEAVRLVGALSGWARDHVDLGPGLGDLAAEAAESLHRVHDHGAGPHPAAAGVAEGAPCTWCPACRAVRAVRSMSPEVRAHLASAATSLVHAAAEALSTPVPDDDRRERPAGTDPGTDPGTGEDGDPGAAPSAGEDGER